jgi:hypothetical protein
MKRHAAPAASNMAEKSCLDIIAVITIHVTAQNVYTVIRYADGGPQSRFPQS